MRATRVPRRSRLAVTGRARIAPLLAAFAAAPLQAQVQALYPLMTDLLDVTNHHGPITLTGSPPPAAPSNGVCVNGIHSFHTGGQDVRTPLLSTLDTNDFEFDVEFNISALPAVRAPVIMGGDSYRFLGICLDANGTVGIKYNNANLAWSQTVLTTSRWYSAALKYEAGEAQLWIDGNLVLHRTVGVLNHGNNLNVTTNDFSSSSNFHGCIRFLLILNNTTILANATPYGAGCAGSAGVPALAAATPPVLGASLQLGATNLVPTAGLAFLAVGFTNISSILGPLPLGLQPFGLASGCDLWTSAETLLLFGTAGGTGTFALAIPNHTGLSGSSLYFQCASIDGAAPGGLTVTNGLRATFGS